MHTAMHVPHKSLLSVKASCVAHGAHLRQGLMCGLWCASASRPHVWLMVRRCVTLAAKGTLHSGPIELATVLEKLALLVCLKTMLTGTIASQNITACNCSSAQVGGLAGTVVQSAVLIIIIC
jgi:hypothetical protein